MAFNVLAWLESRIPGGRVGSSGWRNSRCPFHPDTHPSFGVNTTTGQFKCKAASCGRAGDLVRLVMLIDGLTWREACALVDRPDPFDVDAPLPSVATHPIFPTVNPFPHNLVVVSSQRFPTYLRERGYGLQDALAFGLHFGSDDAGRLRGYLVFPFWTVDGEYVTVSARRMSDNDQHGPRYWRPDQGVASRHLYGAWRFRGIEGTARIFAVEGPFDVMRLWRFGQTAVGLSTSDASAAQINQLAALSSAFSAPVCVLLDTGEAECKRASRIVGRLTSLAVPAYTGILPPGTKDPDRLTDESVSILLDRCSATEVELSA